ncbi:MAG TPA: biosynthetic peptidoglycan transglycosylase, partial [Actinomycetota bacterium]
MSAFPKPRTLLGRLLAAAAGLALTATGCALPHLRLPNERPTIPPLPQTSQILDDRGNLIAILHAGEDRTLVPITEIPVITRNAVVAAEDERFFIHHGVDVKAIVRAALANARSGHIVEGASTITEQLVKNTIGTDEKTLGRKIREAEIAYALEDRYTKLQILELYMNTVYFGQGAYGIEAAAKTYFSIAANALDAGQSALLAGLISSPSRYDPVFHPEAALAQRNYVLGRMRDLLMVGETDYRVAVAAPIGLDLAKPAKRYPAPYFVDYVKR